MKRRTARCAVAIGLALPATPLSPGGSGVNDGAEVGLDDLAARIGAGNVPTGAGVLVAQVELPDAQGDYGPNPAMTGEFGGKTFSWMSGATPVDFSGHANTVARDYYGNNTSIAPGIDEIHLWEVNHWLTTGFLRWSTSPSAPPPLPGAPGLKIVNNSWLAEYTFPNQNNNVLRRADFVVVRDDLVMVVGVDNDEPGNPDDNINVPLMSHMYNGISVGVDDGTHMNDSTLPNFDGPGRMQPTMVAPGAKTSWAIPVVSAAAALMTETARSGSVALGADPLAERSEVIKAVLLGGANHRPGWTNNPATSGPSRGTTITPFDAVDGAGLVNVNTSHLILTGGRHPGSPTVPSAGVPYSGWDLATVGIGESSYFRIYVCGAAEQVSIVTTWHRKVEEPFQNADWFVANFDLFLWRVNEQGGLATLVGDAGLPYFAAGNVTSESDLDNVEHLYLMGLEPGAYVVELRRLDSVAAYPDWDAAVAWTVSAPPPDAADFNGDCTVNVTDLLILLANYNSCQQPCPPACPGDTNGDCEVNVTDLLNLLAAFEPG